MSENSISPYFKKAEQDHRDLQRIILYLDKHFNSQETLAASALQQEFQHLIKKYIFYEDNHLLIIFKPPGFLSQMDKSGIASVIEIFKYYIKFSKNKPGKVFLSAVHRLDRVSAGFLVLARTSKAASRLSSFFREKKVEKIYWALVKKEIKNKSSVIHKRQSGTLSGFFKKDSHGKKMKITHRKSSSKTLPQMELNYRRRDLSAILNKNKSLESSGLINLEVKIESGKFHQIRSLLAAEAMPIVGDIKYGGQKLPGPSHRIALLAKKIAFPHPTREIQINIDLENYMLNLEEDWIKLFAL